MAKERRDRLGKSAGGRNIEAADRVAKEKEKEKKAREMYKKKKEGDAFIAELRKELGLPEEVKSIKKEGRKKSERKKSVEKEVDITTTPREVLESFKRTFNAPMSSRLTKHLESTYLDVKNPTSKDVEKARRAVKIIADVNKAFTSLGVKNYKIDIIPHEKAGFRLVKAGETYLFQVTDTAFKRGFGELRKKAKAYVSNKYAGKKISEKNIFDIYLRDYIKYNMKKSKE